MMLQLDVRKENGLKYKYNEAVWQYYFVLLNFVPVLFSSAIQQLSVQTNVLIIPWYRFLFPCLLIYINQNRQK